MTQQRILVCPLDWGLGHATRCIPLIYTFLKQGHQVFIAGSGPSYRLLCQEFPTLVAIDFLSFTLRYSSGTSQVGAVLKAFPRLVYRTLQEHKELKRIVRQYAITQIVSDNRFGCYHPAVKSIYITHQLAIKFPSPFCFLEPLAAYCHRKLIRKYDECWIPDYESQTACLAGELSHQLPFPQNCKYIGPLSRFSMPQQPVQTRSLTVAVVSGVEPQRTIFEQYLLDSLQVDASQQVVLVQGLPQYAGREYWKGKVRVVASMPAAELCQLLLQAERIYCRSGYSSIMDMHAIGKLNVTTFVPTPGQPEQEYLAAYLRTKNLGEDIQ